MREGDEAIGPAHITSTRAARRRRRLQRGLHVWDLDRRLCAEPTTRIATITLTLASADLDDAYGRVRDFWRRARQTFIGMRYFCWLELQARGQVHYHAVWLNPPHQKRGNLLAWVDRWWGLGRTRVRFNGDRRAIQDQVDYALGYAKKMGRKAYQQRYEAVPRQLRTFMNQRLEIPPAELARHLDRDVWEYVPEGVVAGELREEHLRFVEHLVHEVPDRGRCTALDWRRPRPGAAAGRRAPPLTRAPGSRADSVQDHSSSGG